MAAVAGLPEEDMLSWGWRIPFLASVVLLLIGWFIRVKVAESPDFEAMQKQGKKADVPLLVVLKRHPKDVLVVIGSRMEEVTWFYRSEEHTAELQSLMRHSYAVLSLKNN